MRELVAPPQASKSSDVADVVHCRPQRETAGGQAQQEAEAAEAEGEAAEQPAAAEERPAAVEAQ